MGAADDGGPLARRTVDVSVLVRAPAKLTLSLRVTGVRRDGYHLIDAEMVTLELADTLTIDETGDSLTAGGPYSAGLPLDGSNLVARALVVTRKHAAVHVDKQIPHGGGLGGGSADAAAVLRWAGYTDLDGAARLGADVPFCLVGGRARVRGIGQIVDAMPHLPMDLTLVIPPLACSTPTVFAAWDQRGGLDGADQSCGGPNDLTAAALVVEPLLAEWRDRIVEASGVRPTLAGSGATWFLEGHHPLLRDALTDARVVLTRTT